MLTPLMVLSLDQGKIYGATHPLGRTDKRMNAEANARRCPDQPVDLGSLAARGLPLRPATSFVHILDWLVVLVAVRRTL